MVEVADDPWSQPRGANRGDVDVGSGVGSFQHRAVAKEEDDVLAAAIPTPSDRADVPDGPVTISGYAFAGDDWELPA